MARLIETEECRVELFTAGDAPARDLVVTVDHWRAAPGEAAALEGAGFGGEAALAAGLDVMAVKTTANGWYQDLLVPAVRAALARAASAAGIGGYRRRVGYGGSMGGYGALALARTLSLDRALVLAPQADLAMAGERRWRRELSAITARHGRFEALTRDALAGLGRVAILADPYSEDMAQAAAVAALCRPGAAEVLPVPHGGHQPGAVIGGARVMALLMALIDGQPLAPPRLPRAEARASHLRLFALSQAIERRRGKDGLPAAIVAAERALALSPATVAYRMHLARLLKRAGRLDAALAEAERGAADAPRADHHRLVALVLEAMGRLPEARAAMARAVAAAEAQPGHGPTAAYRRRLAAMEAAA